MTRWVNDVASLADAYDGFVVDQFGVLHDGHQAYPGAADALLALRGRGRRVIVLSNSGKRAEPNAARLAALGIPPQAYDELLSSGELSWLMLQRRDRRPWSALGQRVLLINPGNDAALLQGLALTVVDGAEQADFALLAGLSDQQDAHSLMPPLRSALACRLPLVCANPDRVRLTSRGLQAACGSLAQDYADQGGQVLWVGKPHPMIYARCLELMQAWGAQRLLAVGDSLEHDIAGGASAGLHTCLIAGGIYADRLKPGMPDAQRDKQLRLLCAEHLPPGAPPPDWALQILRWA